MRQTSGSRLIWKSGFESRISFSCVCNCGCTNMWNGVKWISILIVVGTCHGPPRGPPAATAMRRGRGHVPRGFATRRGALWAPGLPLASPVVAFCRGKATCRGKAACVAAKPPCDPPCGRAQLVVYKCLSKMYKLTKFGYRTVIASTKQTRWLMLWPRQRRDIKQ